jgi:hypothetical protein
MKIYTIALLTIPLFCVGQAFAEDEYSCPPRSSDWAFHDEKGWVACESDSECTSIPANCGIPVAVNKRFTDQARQVVSQDCNSMFGQIFPVAAKCLHHECMMVYPEGENCMGMKQAPR